MKEITPDRLQRWLRYDATEGRLYWRERKPVDFSYARGERTPKELCHWWNVRFAGKPAGCYYNRKQGRCILRLQGKALTYARVVWMVVHGYEPWIVRHHDGDARNNRIENLYEQELPDE